jgi:3-hydroxyisobutyrate dehydrogenase
LTDPVTLGPVAFIGLGTMGLPMATRLVEAGYAVRGSDLSAAARTAFAQRGGASFEIARDAAERAAFAIMMLPDGKVVREALLGSGGAAEALRPGALVIDMSSSAPLGTRDLAQELAARRIDLIDAPVSGGLKRALDGSLAIMAGGNAALIEKARPLLELMGRSVIQVGPIGAGHAAKALNNYVSAAGFAAACEAMIVAGKFGIDRGVFIDVLNASTGRNNSTENKMKPVVLSGTFDSGFAMALMAKDVRTAAELAEELGVEAEGAHAAAKLWADALSALGKGADHSELYRFLARGGTG